MNQRIQELAGQAREFATTRHPVSNIVLSVNSDKFEEKFAELIVQECQLRVEQYINECGEIASIPDTVIMKHFGVEE